MYILNLYVSFSDHVVKSFVIYSEHVKLCIRMTSSMRLGIEKCSYNSDFFRWRWTIDGQIQSMADRRYCIELHDYSVKQYKQTNLHLGFCNYRKKLQVSSQSLIVQNTIPLEHANSPRSLPKGVRRYSPPSSPHSNPYHSTPSAPPALFVNPTHRPTNPPLLCQSTTLPFLFQRTSFNSTPPAPIQFVVGENRGVGCVIFERRYLRPELHDTRFLLKRHVLQSCLVLELLIAVGFFNSAILS